ncbi:MAG: hypothetical protein LUD79_03500 [Oscillospiraceae bacterium]|nr:hypothetical protein [Oscillospiraceae bacterium]
MKRIQAACLEQTIRFELKDGVEPETARAMALQEMEGYLEGLRQKRTAFRVVGQTVGEDGVPVLRIKRQYNQYKIGDYLD